MTIDIEVNNDQRIRYIFDVIFLICKIDCSFNYPKKADLTITYGKKIPEINGKHIHIMQSDFWDNYKKLKSMPELPLRRFSHGKFRDLIGLYFRKGSQKAVEERKNLIVINLDIIASIFFMITRYEEYMQPDIKDEFDRFPAKASISYKERFLDRPVVNEYIEFLFSVIKKLEPHIKRENNRFYVLSTHDVDSLLNYIHFPLRFLLGDIIKRKSIKLAIKRFQQYIKAKKNPARSPYYSFDYMNRLEKRANVKSAYYFISKGTSDFKNGYNIDNKKARYLIKKLLENKIEVGLHGSFDSYKNINLLKKEKKRLDKIIGIKSYGTRQHFLRFSIPYTWQIQDKLGFKYDTTCGYADHEGFRCGICHPFNVYDLEKDKVLKLKEVPLIVMDATLKNYRKLSTKKSFKIIKKYVNLCKNYGGVFTMLWHPYIIEIKDKDNFVWGTLYKEVLDYIKNSGRV